MHGNSLVPRVAFTLVLGLAFTAALFAVTRQLEQRNSEIAFTRIAETRIGTLRKDFEQALDALLFLNGAVQAYEIPTSQQFHQLASALLSRYQYIAGLSFRREVKAGQRAAYEAAMRKRHPGFVISDFPHDPQIPAKEADRYRVLEHIEPLASNKKALGLNALSHPELRAAIEKSTLTGQPASSRPFSPGPETGQADSVMITMPVYRLITGGEIPYRGSVVIGDTAMVLSVRQMVTQALQSAGMLKTEDIRTEIYFDNTPAEQHLVFRDGPVTDKPKIPPWLPAWLLYDVHDSIRDTVWLADQPWLVVVSRQPLWFATGHMGSPLILLGGTLLTLLAAAYVSRMFMHASHIEQLVEERTGQLNESKDRLHHLITMSSDWYWEQDASLRLTAIETGPARAAHFDIAACVGKRISELPYNITIGEHYRNRLLAALELKQPYRDIVICCYDDNGSKRFFSISADPLFDPQGRFKGYLGTGKDITEQKMMELKLRESRQRLRELAAYQDSIREDERKRIAREIHDELGQNLLALRIEAAVLHMRTISYPRLNERIGAAISQIDSIMRSVKEIINNLRPTVLDLGLRPALEWQLNQFRKRHRIACELEWHGDDNNLGEQLATALFRIVQESLTNIARHAQAQRANIIVHAEHAQLRMEIRDDGIGLASQTDRKPNSFGLMGIEERIKALQGDFHIASSRDNGTTISIAIPLRRTETSTSRHYTDAPQPAAGALPPL